MKVYIVTAWDNKREAERIAYVLSLDGHTITCEWWNSKGPTLEEAINDVEGVKEADVIIGLFEKSFIYKGAIFELGLAFAYGKKVLIVGDQLDSMIFLKLPNFRKIANIIEAINELK